MSAIPFFALAFAVLGAIAAGLVIHGVFFGYPKAVVPGGRLTRKEQAIIAACADTLFPAGGPIPLSGTQAGAVPYMEAYLARVDAHQRLLIRLLIHFVEHAPWIFGPRCARFTRLTPAERVTSLREMSQSGIYFRRVTFLSLRIMLTMAYFANDEVARCIGVVSRPAPFDPSPIRAPEEVPA